MNPLPKLPKPEFPTRKSRMSLGELLRCGAKWLWYYDARHHMNHMLLYVIIRYIISCCYILLPFSSNTYSIIMYTYGSIPFLLTMNHFIFIAPGHVFKLMMLLGGLPRSLGDTFSADVWGRCLFFINILFHRWLEDHVVLCYVFWRCRTYGIFHYSSLSHHLQGLIHPTWYKMSSVNSIIIDLPDLEGNTSHPPSPTVLSFDRHFRWPECRLACTAVPRVLHRCDL